MNVALSSSGFRPAVLLRSVRNILKKNRLWSMATIGRAAHINTAYFCYSENLDFYFTSDKFATHIRNLRRSSRVAVAIYDSAQAWETDHRGLQMFGSCRPVRGGEEDKARALYAKRYPAYRKYLASLSQDERDASPYRFYLFRPDRIKILDERSFGEEVLVIAQITRA